MGDVSQDHIKNEARAIAKLCSGKHRNIVNVYDTGIMSESPLYFIDMELCDLHLGAFLQWAASPFNDQNIPWFTREMSTKEWDAQILGILIDICNGLCFIHTELEIHRDLKPHNGEFVSEI